VAMLGYRVLVTVGQPGQFRLEAACNAEVSRPCWVEPHRYLADKDYCTRTLLLLKISISTHNIDTLRFSRRIKSIRIPLITDICFGYNALSVNSEAVMTIDFRVAPLERARPC
jgi:hypothetical protein